MSRPIIPPDTRIDIDGLHGVVGAVLCTGGERHYLVNRDDGSVFDVPADVLEAAIDE